MPQRCLAFYIPVGLGDLSCLCVVLEVCDEVLEHLAPRPLLHTRKVGRSVRGPLRIHHLVKEKIDAEMVTTFDTFG